MENFWPEGSRVGFASTEELRETLSSTFSLLSFGDGEKELFKKSIETENGDFVPYSCFRKIACDPRTSQTHSARLEATLRHSKLLLPQLREIQKSEELKERLESLQLKADELQYAKLVKDITRKEKDEEEREYLATFKDQIGLGIHVIAIMFTGYVAGHTLFRTQFDKSPFLHAAGGILGLVLGMLLEVILFMVRSSMIENKTAKDKKKRQRRLVGKVEKIPDSREILQVINPSKLKSVEFRGQTLRSRKQLEK